MTLFFIYAAICAVIQAAIIGGAIGHTDGIPEAVCLSVIMTPLAFATLPLFVAIKISLLFIRDE